MSITAALLAGAGFLGMGGVTTTIVEFDPDSPWYYLGLTLIAIAAMGAVGGCLSSHRTRIVAAFDAGYQAGYRKGRRKFLRPAVIDVRTGRVPERSPRP